MTKPERRVRDFSTKMKGLSNNSRDYIHKLSHALLLVDKPPVSTFKEEDIPEWEKECKKNL